MIRPLLPFRASASLLLPVLVLALTAGPVVPPAAAQNRELGPPPGINLEAEDLPEEMGEPEREIEPPPPPFPPEADKKPVEKLMERLRSSSGMQIELLDIPITDIPNYRNMMREIVEELSIYGRARDPNFIVLVHHGFDILYWSQREYDVQDAKRNPTDAAHQETIRPVDMPMRHFIRAINGFVADGQFCSPLRISQIDLKAAREEGLTPLSFDHCESEEQAVNALGQAVEAKIVTFAEGKQDFKLSTIPDRRPVAENASNIQSLGEARNVLPLFNARAFGTREDWLVALRNNNYDIIIIDGFDRTNHSLSRAELHSIKFKQTGARRLVLARLDIGHADDSRYYFKRDWQVGSPSWIESLGTDYFGQYNVEYWNPAWKAIIGRYFAGIVDLGFDGVYLDGIEAYRTWEAKTPISLER